MLDIRKIFSVIAGISLILGIAFIAFSFLSAKNISLTKNSNLSPSPAIAYLDLTKMNIFMRPVDKDDHIRGRSNAPIKLVEFADFECPFCKKLHMTMKELTKEYETKGKVAWVYRHAFSEALHKKARQEAEASECASELGGNDAFWKYADKIFEITPSDDGLDLALLPQIAKEIGLNEEEFNTCLSGRRHEQRVTRDISDAMTAGARGTPYVVIVGPNNKRYDFSGTQPKEFIKNLIDLALAGK